MKEKHSDFFGHRLSFDPKSDIAHCVYCGDKFTAHEMAQAKKHDWEKRCKAEKK